MAGQLVIHQHLQYLLHTHIWLIKIMTFALEEQVDIAIFAILLQFRKLRQ